MNFIIQFFDTLEIAFEFGFHFANLVDRVNTKEVSHECHLFSHKMKTTVTKACFGSFIYTF